MSRLEYSIRGRLAQIDRDIGDFCDRNEPCPKCGKKPDGKWRWVIMFGDRDFAVTVIHETHGVETEWGTTEEEVFIDEDGHPDHFAIAGAIADGRACSLGWTTIEQGWTGLLATILLTEDNDR